MKRLLLIAALACSALAAGCSGRTANALPAAPLSVTPSATADLNATAALQLSSASPYVYKGCHVFTAGDWFTTNLVTHNSSYVPSGVDPRSATIIGNLTAVFGSMHFSTDVNPRLQAANIDTKTNAIADPTIQDLPVGFANDPQNNDPAPHHIPITGGTFYQEGTSGCSGDCHVQVLNTATCIDYETYKSGSKSWNGWSYSAYGGGVENLNYRYAIEPIAVSAADIPMIGTADYGEDLSYQQSFCRPNCAIPHTVAVYFGSAGEAVGGPSGQTYVWPADYGMQCSSHCTRSGRNAALPYGARLRLHSTYTCPSPTTYPQANLLCNQAKQYGWIFDDTVGGGAAGLRLALSTNGANPWNGGDYGQFLGRVTFSDFDVVTLGTLR